MQLNYYTYLEGKWSAPLDADLDTQNTLVILFGASQTILVQTALSDLKNTFTTSTIIGASSAGEIAQDEIQEGSLVVAILCFEESRIQLVVQKVQGAEESFDVGKSIANALCRDDLKSIFLLSDGLSVNGSQLTKGLNERLPENIIVTGGLAADGDRFKSTWVIVDGEAVSGYVTAVGLYGKLLHVEDASRGGWDKLGISRKVTRAKDNVLYELDYQPALAIYKRYLGDKASELPASGLLFPLELLENTESEASTVRTILAVNEEENSITFAGDIPEGSEVALMKANFDRLIDGASQAAESIQLQGYHNEPLLNIAISCVGRRLVLKQRTEDELEAVLEALPSQTRQIGFYSYGEISPLASGRCDLHNQTMTLTLIWESDA